MAGLKACATSAEQPPQFVALHHARDRGTSVSRVVETMLSLVSRPDTKGALSATAAPVLTRLRGAMKRGSVSGYRRHLRREYR